MARFLKRHTPVIAALVVLVLGGSVAALAAVGTRPAHAHHGSGARSTRGWKLTQSAAAYIGVSTEALEADVRSGKSLGQVATEAGKSEAGLVKALASTANAGLEQRIAQAVKQPGGIRARHKHDHRLRLAAAGYLGITPAALSTQLKAGKTLAQVADATPGHSKAGLIDALVAARTSQSSSNTKLSGAKHASAAKLARLRAHISRFVEHSHTAAPAHSPAPAHRSGG